MKVFFNILKYKAGQSLVEIMVASGLIGGLALGIGTLMQSQTKTQKGIEAKFRGDLLFNDIMSTLGDPTACLNTFGGMNPTNAASVSVSIIKDASNANKFILNTPYQDRSVQITSMSFGGTTETAWSLDAAGSYTGMATLKIMMTKIGTVAGAPTVTKKFKIKVTLSNPTNLVTACTSASTSPPPGGSSWQTNGSTLYYDEGNVAVMGTIASSPLTVSGTINVLSYGVIYPDNISQPTSSGIWNWSMGFAAYSHPTGYQNTKAWVGIGPAGHQPKAKLDVAEGSAIKAENLYLSSALNQYAEFGGNAWYNTATTTWNVPNAGYRAAFMQINIADSSTAFCQSGTAGSISPLACPFQMSATGAISGGSYTTSCSIVSAAGSGTVNVACAAGTTMTGGGCNAGANPLTTCYPSASNVFTGYVYNCCFAQPVTVYAVCCQ